MCSKSFAKKRMSEICLLMFIQPSGNSSLWDQQSFWDSRSARLWSCPPTIPSPSACLTRVAPGRKGAARSFCLWGICLSICTRAGHLHMKTTTTVLLCVCLYSFFFCGKDYPYTHISVCVYRYCSYVVEDWCWTKLAIELLKPWNK